MIDDELSRKNSGLKILLVDDSDIIRGRIKIILSRIPFKLFIIEAANADETLECLLKIKPDIIIMDIKMPGENGFCLLKELKKDYGSIKTIIMTNYPHPQYRQKCFELGADYFLSKLAEFDKLPYIVTQISINSLFNKKVINEY